VRAGIPWGNSGGGGDFRVGELLGGLSGEGAVGEELAESVVGSQGFPCGRLRRDGGGCWGQGGGGEWPAGRGELDGEGQRIRRMGMLAESGEIGQPVEGEVGGPEIGSREMGEWRSEQFDDILRRGGWEEEAPCGAEEEEGTVAG
jgi:hypothetical protein